MEQDWIPTYLGREVGPCLPLVDRITDTMKTLPSLVLRTWSAIVWQDKCGVHWKIQVCLFYQELQIVHSNKTISF